MRSLFLTHVLVGSSQARVINDVSPIFHWLSQLAVHERTYPRLALVQKEGISEGVIMIISK